MSEEEKINFLLQYFKDKGVVNSFIDEVTPKKIGKEKYFFSLFAGQRNGLEFIGHGLKVNPVIITEAQNRRVKELLKNSIVTTENMLKTPKKLNKRTIASLYTRAETFGDVVFGLRKGIWKLYDDIREGELKKDVDGVLNTLRVVETNVFRLVFNLCIMFAFKRGKIVAFDYGEGSVMLYSLYDLEPLYDFHNFSDINYVHDLKFDLPMQTLVALETQLKANDMVSAITSSMRLLHWTFEFILDVKEGGKYVAQSIFA
ncbi:hypothetical protein [Metallosphaera sp.]|uniref:hypothetical protein n=1 Tax=Metallosphaera sp. TaxID=2020860 RepID=UPI00316AF9E7